MKIEEILLEKISKEERHKLNVMSFYLRRPPLSSKTTVYLKNGGECKFYNSTDIVSSKLFHKRVSLLPNIKL